MHSYESAPKRSPSTEPTGARSEPSGSASTPKQDVAEPSLFNRATSIAQLSRLQQTAGNQAVFRMLQRAVVGTPVATVTFTVGTELTATVAAAAKAAVADGRVDDVDLAAMRQSALATDGTVNDDERMFMAGLLDPVNVQNLRAMRRFAAVPDSIDFPAASITPERRARIANLDRPKLPADVASESALALDAAKRDLFGEIGAVAAHLQAAEVAAAREIVTITGSFAPTAKRALDAAAIWNVSPVDVLRAMIAAASDSTPGDLALAAAVYVIARLSGSPLAGDILAGRIKVDQVPSSSLPAGEWAGYKAAGAGGKGDTITVPSDFDVFNLAHRGAVVHELKHAADDKAAAGPQVKRSPRDELELRGYRAQARFLLDMLGPLGAAGFRAGAAQQVASIWNPLLLGAMILEALNDPAGLKPIVIQINDAAPATGRASKQDIETLFTWNATRLEVALLGQIRKAYAITTPSGNKALGEGLSGESILDWIDRPMGP